jgi:hypothetical protein
MTRHYGLDWLRIGAFAVLILYHVGMVFVPWGYHAKLASLPWVALPMMASNPWRLLLLFAVSGYASRALLAREPKPARFAGMRSRRLLIPLLFGVALVVPVQPWVELVTQHGYGAGFATFYARDYWRWGLLDGVMLPTWAHLWFVAYLWVYTVVLAGGAALPQRWRAAMQAGFDRVLAGPGVVAWPMLYLVVADTWLFPGATETHALYDDRVAHATYLPAFLWGVGLAGSPATLGWLARQWRWCLGLATVAYGGVIAVEWTWAGRPPFPYGHLFSAGRAVEGWAAVTGLVGLAERHWNRNTRLRATLTEAVFPFYLVHQSIIVGVAGALAGRGLGHGAEFAVLVAATLGGCWAFYVIARSIEPLRPLVGLRPRPAGQPAPRRRAEVARAGR